MNSFLSKYLRKKCTLGQFVVHFENALKLLFERENDADLESKLKTPNLVTGLEIEKKYRDSYTNAMFYRCQRGIRSSFFTCLSYF
jgi:predicted nucleotidyltransferase